MFHTARTSIDQTRNKMGSRRIFEENSHSDDDIYIDEDYEIGESSATEDASETSDSKDPIEDDIQAEINELNLEIEIFTKKVAKRRAHVQYLQKQLRAQRRSLVENADSVLLGPGGTRVPASVVDRVLSQTYTRATRALLVAVFGNRVLAESSLTGNRSNAHPNTAAKRRLDPDKVADIVHYVKVHFTVEKTLIHHCITTKCADEAKAVRKNAHRRSSPER